MPIKLLKLKLKLKLMLMLMLACMYSCVPVLVRYCCTLDTSRFDIAKVLKCTVYGLPMSAKNRPSSLDPNQAPVTNSSLSYLPCAVARLASN